jgi:parvulin-like peptidyl-prolyl isomerase
MGNIARLLLLATAVVALAACGGSGPKSVPSDAVAVVGDQVITKAQYDEVINQAKRSYVRRHTPFPKPGTSGYAAIRTQVMQFLVEKAEYDQKAKDMGIHVSKKQIDDRLDQIKKQYFTNPPGKKPPSKAEIERRYKKQLKAQGLTDAEVREGIRSQLVREAIYNKVTKDVKVSDSDVKDYYKKNKSQYETPALPTESRDVRHVLVKSKALADTVYKKLKHGADFAAMVNRYSADQGSKATGGRLKVCKKQIPGSSCLKTVPQFEKVAFALKTNEISKPVHSQFGWHIIQALGPVIPPQKAKATPYNQVKDAIRQQLEQQKKQDSMNKWWDDTKKEFKKKIAYQTGYAPSQSSNTSTGP